MSYCDIKALLLRYSWSWKKALKPSTKLDSLREQLNSTSTVVEVCSYRVWLAKRTLSRLRKLTRFDIMKGYLKSFNIYRCVVGRSVDFVNLYKRFKHLKTCVRLQYNRDYSC